MVSFRAMGRVRALSFSACLWVVILSVVLLAVDGSAAADFVHESSKEAMTRGSLSRRTLPERSLLQSSDLPPFMNFVEGDPAVPEDGPLKKGNKDAGTNSHGLHYSLDAEEIFQRAHGNPNWPNQNSGNGNGPNGNGNGKGLGYGLTEPEQPAGVACTVTDNCVIPSQNSPISYHGGPTMFLTQKFPKISSYVIFYGGSGDWQDATSANIINDFLSNVGGSDRFQTNQGNMFTAADPINNAGYYYRDANYPNAFPPNGAGNPGFGGYVFDRTWKKGSRLSQTSLQNIVANAVSKSRQGIQSTAVNGQYPAQGLPIDGSGIYFVLTAAGLSSSISGFCTQFCGYHTFYQQTGVVSQPFAPSVYLKWSFVGDPANCMTSCSSYNRQVSPNGRPSIDAMISVIVHELEETVTDVNNGWYDSVTGMENSDKCAWTYGALSTGTTSTGAAYYYNSVIGSRQYLLQMNYVNDNNGLGYCAMTYNYPHQVPIY